MTQGFSKVKLRCVLEERSGITWDAEQESPTPVPGALPVLTVTNVQETLETEPMLYIRGVSERDRQRKAAKQGWTIAVGSNGNRGRIGNCVFIERDTEYLFASFLVGFRPKPDSGIDPEYFYRWMSSYETQVRLSASSEGTTGLGNLSSRYFRNMWIDYPTDPREQQRVIKVLRLVDSAIAAARETIAKVERLQKGLMQQLLTGRLKPSGEIRLDSEWHEHPRLGRFPSTWKAGPAKEFFVLQRGFDLPDADAKPGQIPVVKSNGVENYHDTSQVVSPGVVTGRSGTIGQVFYVEQPFWPHNTTLYVKDFRGNEPRFIYFLLKSLHLERHLAGTTIPTLNRNDIHRLWITAPSSTKEQREIATALHNCESLVLAKQKKIAALQRLKKSLMQNLLTGRVRLPVNGAAKDTTR